VRAGTSDPDGYDLIANATPAGMKDGDALPIEVSRLAPSTYCGCVITKPEVSPFIQVARKVGCLSATGTDMYDAQQSILVDFLPGLRRMIPCRTEPLSSLFRPHRKHQRLLLGPSLSHRVIEEMSV